jgi:hypothetical protein
MIFIEAKKIKTQTRQSTLVGMETDSKLKNAKIC